MNKISVILLEYDYKLGNGREIEGIDEERF